METSLINAIYEEMCLTIKPQTPLKPKFLVTEQGLQARAGTVIHILPRWVCSSPRVYLH